MARQNPDWLQAYLRFASHSEAPIHMHFWSGVSAIAGALQRKCWIDQRYFKWYPNFYIVLVAPPGIVSKSTTIDTSISLLREVPGVKFGPNICTWQSLMQAFENSTVGVDFPDGTMMPMSALTLESSEFGNLLDPTDKQMIDLMVNLWDGKTGEFTKTTKTNGNETVVNPWINLIACTTPSWLQGSFPEYMVGGGFTSRTIFVYADRKAQIVAYPGRRIDVENQDTLRASLVADLTSIATLTGEFTLTDEAYEWGEEWYKKHYSTQSLTLDGEKFGGYLARKQTHIHKLAMVLSAATREDLVITKNHLITANTMVTDLEPDLRKVFAKVGRSAEGVNAQDFVEYVNRRKEVVYEEAYRQFHSRFPSSQKFGDMLKGCVESGHIRIVKREGKHYLVSLHSQ